MAPPLHPISAQPIPADKAGVGLRAPHHRPMAEQRPAVGWLEAHSENYLAGGRSVAVLEQLRPDYPLSLHGVGLSLGGAERPESRHLARIAALIAAIEPALVSEHVSWCAAGGVFLNDLLPLPWTEEALALLACNIDIVQTALGRTILVENPSSYLTFAQAQIPEWEFLVALAERSGCGILLDVNNIYVSAQNLGFDPRAYLAAIPAALVGEIHLAGHHINELDDGAKIYIDDHGSAVADPVWSLFAEAAAKFPDTPVLIEWDTRIPSLDVLVAEAAKADAHAWAARRGQEVRHAGVA